MKRAGALLIVLLLFSISWAGVKGESNSNVENTIILNFYFKPQLSGFQTSSSTFISFLHYDWGELKIEASLIYKNSFDYKNLSFNFSLNSNNNYSYSVSVAKSTGNGYVAQYLYIYSKAMSLNNNLAKMGFSYQKVVALKIVKIQNNNYFYSIPVNVTILPISYFGSDLSKSNLSSMFYLFIPYFNSYPAEQTTLQAMDLNVSCNNTDFIPASAAVNGKNWIAAVFWPLIVSYNYTYIEPEFYVKILSSFSAGNYSIIIFSGDSMGSYNPNLSYFNSFNVSGKTVIYNNTQQDALFHIVLNDSVTNITIFVKINNLVDAYFLRVYHQPLLKILSFEGSYNHVKISEYADGNDIGFGTVPVNNTENISFTNGSFYVHYLENPITAPDYSEPYFSYPIGPIFLNNSILYSTTIYYMYRFLEPLNVLYYIASQNSGMLKEINNLFDSYNLKGGKNWVEFDTFKGNITVTDLFGFNISLKPIILNLNSGIYSSEELNKIISEHNYVIIKKLEPVYNVTITRENGSTLTIKMLNFGNLPGVQFRKNLTVEYTTGQTLYTLKLNLTRAGDVYYTTITLPKTASKLELYYFSNSSFVESFKITEILEHEKTVTDYNTVISNLFIFAILVLAIAWFWNRRRD